MDDRIAGSGTTVSTTRWIIETPCQVCAQPHRVVVDPDNLPPEAWRVLNAASAFGHPGGSVALWNDITQAFLSDPEQGDQT